MKKYAVILAAGKGTRMKSELPKVLHEVCGQSMIEHLIDKLEKANVDEIIAVVGHKSDMIKKRLGDRVTYAEQTEQLGTAHAVSQAAPHLADKNGKTIVLTGDTPLISQETIENLLESHNDNISGMVLTATQDNPKGYGRIIRSNSEVMGIVEEKDASSDEKAIKEVNTGIFCFDNALLFKALPLISSNNAQEEFYLTDIVSTMKSVSSKDFTSVALNDPEEALGVNNRIQLAQAEKFMRRKINETHMVNGVTLIDPDNTYIENSVLIGSETIIYPNTNLKGMTEVGENCIIKSGTEIIDSTVGNNSTINCSFIGDSILEEHSKIGPYSVLLQHTKEQTFQQSNQLTQFADN